MSLRGYPTTFLKCRTFGHTWEEYIPAGKRKPEFGFRFSLLCTTCNMERHDIADTNGNLATRQYVQPDGYYLGYTLPRDEARVAYKRRKRKKYHRGDLVREL